MRVSAEVRAGLRSQDGGLELTFEERRHFLGNEKTERLGERARRPRHVEVVRDEADQKGDRGATKAGDQLETYGLQRGRVFERGRVRAVKDVRSLGYGGRGDGEWNAP